jgi:SAM-dependent methyltransferase
MSHSHAERQLILLSASTADRRHTCSDDATRLMTEVDWSQFAETLHVRKLLPLLGPRILDLAEGSASDDFVAKVEQALEVGRRQGVFLQLVAVRIVAMLAEAGIRSTPLKGPFLSEAIYQDPGRRLSGDIDLLVAPDQLQAAVEVVRELGYDALGTHVASDGLPLLHFALVHEPQKLPPVELHWRVHWYERDFAREQLLPPAGSASVDWRPAPIDEFASLLLFYARDGFVDLRLATDLSAWWDMLGAGVQPGAFDRLLHVYPALSRVLTVSLKVVERIVGIPAGRLIFDRPKVGLRSRVAIRLANPNPRVSQPQLYADMGLIDGLLAPPGGFGAFIRRQVLPPPEVLNEQARHGAKRRPRSPWSRFVGMLVRYSVALIRSVRAPETSIAIKSRREMNLKVTKNTFTAGHGGSRVASYLDIVRYQRRGNERLAQETVHRARMVKGYTDSQISPQVLDLGCGGRAGVVLSLHTLGVSVTGIDYDVIAPRPSLSSWARIVKQNGIERAAKTVGRQLMVDTAYYRRVQQILGTKLRWDALDVRTMDARKMEFDKDTFSFVFSAAVFEHIADIESATAELHRVMRPGGYAYILTHLFPSLSGGHALDWADPDDAPRLNTSVPPWDHLRKQGYPAHVYLNKLRAEDYLESFGRFFEIQSQEYTTEGHQLLTPELRAELSDWTEEDLTRRFLIVLLRKSMEG